MRRKHPPSSPSVSPRERCKGLRFMGLGGFRVWVLGFRFEGLGFLSSGVLGFGV